MTDQILALSGALGLLGVSLPVGRQGLVRPVIAGPRVEREPAAEAVGHYATHGLRDQRVVAHQVPGRLQRPEVGLLGPVVVVGRAARGGDAGPLALKAVVLGRVVVRAERPKGLAEAHQVGVVRASAQLAVLIAETLEIAVPHAPRAGVRAGRMPGQPALGGPHLLADGHLVKLRLAEPLLAHPLGPASQENPAGGEEGQGLGPTPVLLIGGVVVEGGPDLAVGRRGRERTHPRSLANRGWRFPRTGPDGPGSVRIAPDGPGSGSGGGRRR